MKSVAELVSKLKTEELAADWRKRGMKISLFRPRLIIGLPPRMSYFQAWMLEHLPGKLMSRDNYRSMQVPNTCSAPFPFQLQPQALEAVAPAYLAPSGPRERYPQLRWRARR